MIASRRIFAATLFGLTLLQACNKGNTPAMISQEDKELLERVKAKEREREQLRTTPARFIQTGQWERFDKGIINTYTRATSVVFTNNSQFDVADIRGKISYLNGQEQEMATVPFKATGELPAGQTLKLNVSAGEISGGASTARIAVESVRVRE
jgi:hypothetical protein